MNAETRVVVLIDRTPGYVLLNSTYGGPALAYRILCTVKSRDRKRVDTNEFFNVERHRKVAFRRSQGTACNG